MKKIACLALTILLSQLTFSQAEEKQTDVDPIHKKNSIGLEFGSIFSDRIRSEIIYRRQIANRFNLKFSLGTNELFASYNEDPKLVKIINQNTFYGAKSITEGVRLNVTTGLEYTYAVNNFHFLIGGDIMYSYKRVNTIDTYNYYIDGVEQTDSASNQLDFTTKYNDLGLALNVGVRYNLSSKFNITTRLINQIFIPLNNSSSYSSSVNNNEPLLIYDKIDVSSSNLGLRLSLNYMF